MAKITLVTRNFPPLTGGMETLLHHVYLQLKHRHRCDLIGPQGCREYADQNDAVIESTVSPTPLFLGLSFVKSVVHLLLKGRPDVVMGGSGLVGPVVVLLAVLFRAKAVVIVHGLDIIVESRFYQRLFVPFLRRADLIICNSKNTADLAVKSGVGLDRIEIISPGVEMPSDPIAQIEAKELLGLQGKTLLLSVGRLIPRKGLAEFITKSFVELAAMDPTIELLIAGGEARQALNKHSGSTLDAIKAAIQENGLEAQVRLLGQVEGASLAQLYAAADAFIFPLIETRGDVEGFGMVAIEAAAYGTPTVAFDCGGVSDAIENGKNGYLVAPGNYAEFSRVVRQVVEEATRESCVNYAKNFSWENYSRKLHMSIDKVVS